MKNNIRQNKGITLIALVITIIVLLILVGITIASLTGENGLLSRATEAGDATKRGDLIDRVKLDILNDKAGNQGNASNLSTILGKYFTSVPQDLTDMTAELTAKSEYGGYTVTLGEVLGEAVASNPPAGGTSLKVGDTDLSTVSDISTMYGETTDYKSTSHSSINWQLFYADSSNYYLIASDYVPNAELPCNGSTVNGVTYTATDLVKSTNTTNQLKTYCARFASSTSYNDGVLTAGTIYKNGSASTAFTATAGSQYLTTNYLKWVAANPSSTNDNICAVAYMMDTNKWSSFADGVSGAYAIGGPTIEMLSLSWNAVSGHTQMTDYTTLSSSNSNTNGYNAQSPETGSNFFGTSTNMWFIKEQIKAYGYWLASPSSNGADYVRNVHYNGYVSSYGAFSGYGGFRPIVCIPK